MSNYDPGLVDRVPPQDIEAEISVIGSMLVSMDAVIAVSPLLVPEDFYRHAHGVIYRAISDLHKQGDPVDLITVSSRLRDKEELDDVGGYGYLMDAASSIPTAVNAHYYARIVRDKSLLREAIKAGATIIEKAFNHDGPVSDFIDGAEQVVMSLNQTYGDGHRNEPAPLSAILTNVFDTIERRYENQDHVTGKPTGFYDLDYMTSGLNPSDLIILAARPAMGKTSFALNLAQNVARNTGEPTLVFSLEMDKEQLVQRMLCSEGKIDSHRLKTGFLSEGDWPRLTEAMGALAAIPVHIDDTPSVTVNDVRSKARALISKTKKKLSLIVIDYLQLMSGGGSSSKSNSENRQQEISIISRSLKGLARELQVPIIALSQLSRAVESRSDKRPMLSDLRESGSLEQDADIVMFIYRDEYYNPESPDKSIAEVILAKHRNGPVGKVKLFFEKEHTRFENLTTSIQPN